MKLRYQIIPHFTIYGWVADVQLRREHVDPPLQWNKVWSTEPYRKELDAINRAKMYVKEHHPEAIR